MWTFVDLRLQSRHKHTSTKHVPKQSLNGLNDAPHNFTITRSISQHFRACLVSSVEHGQHWGIISFESFCVFTLMYFYNFFTYIYIYIYFFKCEQYIQLPAYIKLWLPVFAFHMVCSKIKAKVLVPVQQSCRQCRCNCLSVEWHAVLRKVCWNLSCIYTIDSKSSKCFPTVAYVQGGYSLIWLASK